jgi:formylglycine-generating enzyme required for sulfatase activity
MGCSMGDAECAKDEKPPREVDIAKGFWLTQTEVSQEAFQDIVGSNPSNIRGASLPAERVTWTEAVQYCQAIGGRLPTEAEWEYAARAGTTGSRYGPAAKIAWFKDNRTDEAETHTIAKMGANAWGLHDTLGNVAEWVADWYDPVYYGTGGRQDPGGPASGRLRVRRGGDFTSSIRALRVSARDKGAPDQRYAAQGFRCVVDVH